VCRLNKGKLLRIIPAMVFAAGIELLHAGLLVLLIQPFTKGVEVMLSVSPAMIIINSVGVGIAVVIIKSKDDIITLKGRGTQE
jgi:LytS/YehU family sensor histidine kinase